MKNYFMKEAIRLSINKMRSGEGGPFGAVVVKDDKIVGRGFNCVTLTNDPTAHAEIIAIRDACKYLEIFTLKGCTLYTSCEPCPMCLSAIYWARLDIVYYANNQTDAAKIGFDDTFIYEELRLPIPKRKLIMKQVMRKRAFQAFEEWEEKEDKITY